MNNVSAVRKIQALLPFDINCGTVNRKRSSSYCTRLKQLQLMNASYSQKRQQRKSFIVCMGETSQLNNFLIRTKPKLTAKTHQRHKTLQNENLPFLDLSPWESQTPRQL